MAALEEYLLFENMLRFLKLFINDTNSFHPSITFTANWTKEKAIFLDVEVTLQNDVLSTDLFVKNTDAYQYWDPTSCFPHCCKIDIPFSQKLRRNRICSSSNSFDKQCNELKEWLLEKNYSEKLYGNSPLKKVKSERNDS